MIEKISDTLSPACIKLDIQGRKKPEIIAELVQIFADAGEIGAPGTISEQVQERETMMSTGIGGGIAVPHCLSSAVNETMLAFGRHQARVPDLTRWIKSRCASFLS